MFVVETLQQNPDVSESRRAKCAAVNEILVISGAHCLLSSSSLALLRIREELSVPLMLKEPNGTRPTKFYEGYHDLVGVKGLRGEDRLWGI